MQKRTPRSGRRPRALAPRLLRQCPLQQLLPLSPPPQPLQRARARAQPPRQRRPRQCPRPRSSAPPPPPASRRALTTSWQRGQENLQQRGGRRRRARSPLPVRSAHCLPCPLCNESWGLLARLLPAHGPCAPTSPRTLTPPHKHTHLLQTRGKSLRACSSTLGARLPLQCPLPGAARCRRCPRAGAPPWTPAAARSTFTAAMGRRRGRGRPDGGGGEGKVCIGGSWGSGTCRPNPECTERKRF